MENNDNNIIKRFISACKKHRYLCNAPFTSMNISTIGMVSPCCYNTTLCDNYSKRSITEIFNGKIYKQYRKEIKKGKFHEACSICRNSMLNGQYNSVMIHNYDYFKVSRIFPNKIRNITIALSNVCNLECIMCNGLNSSSIRINRDKQEPISLPYMKRFRNEIKPLLPNMQAITFSGGEPFLNLVYYEIWEDIIKINPQITLNVFTNGTILNERIKTLLDKGNFNIIVSFNGITKETYETVHVNGNFEETQNNIMYFGDYMKKNNKTLSISICPLKQNKFEIPDIVRFCNKNNFLIDIQNVIGAVDVALFSSTEDELVQIKEFYQKQKFEKTNDICLKNESEFNDLTRRIDYWIELAKKKTIFMNLFDLGTDKVDFYEKQLFNNLENILCEINNEDEAQLIIQNTQKKLHDILNKQPVFFRCNHFYQRLSALSPVLFLEYFMYGNVEWLCSECNEIFYYGLNHG